MGWGLKTPREGIWRDREGKKDDERERRATKKKKKKKKAIKTGVGATKREMGRDRGFSYLGLFTFGESHSIATGRRGTDKEKFKIEREGGRWGKGKKISTVYIIRPAYNTVATSE